MNLKYYSVGYSQRLKQNIALAIVATECVEPGTEVEVEVPDEMVQATVVERLFYNPKNNLLSYRH